MTWAVYCDTSAPVMTRGGVSYRRVSSVLVSTHDTEEEAKRKAATCRRRRTDNWEEFRVVQTE